MQNIAVKKINTVPSLMPYDNITYKKCGNVLEATFTTACHSFPHIKNLNKNEYVDLLTGEVKQKKHNIKRIDNIRTIKQSHSNLRDIINSNVIDTSFCKWLTLTYAENMTDYKKGYIDFKNFIKKLRYNIQEDFEYIVCPEPQGRGAWHYHVILIFKAPAPFIENSVISNLWSNGFTSTKKIDNVDNVGAYLTAYLENMPDTNAKGKKYIKGQRMALYPIGMKLYRTSKGIKRPIIKTIKEKELQKETKNLILTYSKTFEITIDDKVLIVYKRSWNLKRIKKIKEINLCCQKILPIEFGSLNGSTSIKNPLFNLAV